MVLAAMLLTAGFSVVAQNGAVPITAGRFFVQRGVQSQTNAQFETANFNALSWINGDGSGNSIWDICSGSSNPRFCKAGSTFTVPNFPTMQVGFCGACSPPQFPFGTFTINGTNYTNVYFLGHLDFSQATFLVAPSHLAKRKGHVVFRSPFTVSGFFQACRTGSDFCTAANVLYEGHIEGHGTMTVTTRIVYETQISPRPFLVGESIEYQFEP